MARITRICKLGGIYAGIALAALSCAVGAAQPSHASVDQGRNMERYVSARLAQIENRNDQALKGYLRLFKGDPESPEIAGRLFENAVIEGDMQNALRAVRVMELRGETESTAAILTFVAAFQKSKWADAKLAVADLENKRNFGFIAPILSSWVNVASGKPHGFKRVGTRGNSLLAYYSSDQRVYLELASGRMHEAKQMLSGFARLDDSFARDLSISAAPIFAAAQDKKFARLLLQNRVDADLVDGMLSNRRKFTAEQGLAALFTRLANALVEQKAADQALIMARMANWIYPKSDPAKLALSTAFFESGFKQKAAAILKTVKPSSPYWMRSANDRVKRLAANGEAQAALGLAKHVFARRPKSSNALLLLGQMQEESGEYADAAKSYGELLARADRDAMSPRRKALYMLFLATALDKGGDWTAAKEKLAQGKKLDPNNPYILNYLGFSMLERGESFDKALGLLKNAYLLSPKSAAIADSLGWAYYKNDDFGKAVSYLEKAVLKSQNDQTINEHLGDAYWKTGRKVAARYAWIKAAYRVVDEDEQRRLQQKIEYGLPIAISAKK